MTKTGPADRWCRAMWGQRARALVLVVTGALVAGAGVAYFNNRRQREKAMNDEERQKRKQQDEATSGPTKEMRKKNSSQSDQGGQGGDDTARRSPASPELYLTSTGPNLQLLKMLDSDGSVEGGFGEITFGKTESGLEVALKMAKDTVSGRRQQQREIEFLINFKRLHPVAENIVHVIEARTTPVGMLLMRRERQTLTSMVEDAAGIDVVAVEKALLGVLTAIDDLDRSGFLHRDIKGDNILVGKDGTGILADFGLCMGKTDACQAEYLGDGTPDYCALEISNKLSGSTLGTELFSLFVVLVESVMRRHPFGGEHLYDAKEDRLDFLQEQRENLMDDAQFLRDQLKDLLDEEEDDQEEEMLRKEQQLRQDGEMAGLMSKLEGVHIREWRLGVRSPRQWRPNAAARAVLSELGEPLSFFKKLKKRSLERQDFASLEAKADPSRVFEGDDWVDWLPGPSRADCKEGVKLAVNFLLGKGVLHPDPSLRPQTVQGARDILRGTVAIYEEQRVREQSLEQGGLGGAPVEDEAGG